MDNLTQLVGNLKLAVDEKSENIGDVLDSIMMQVEGSDKGKTIDI